MEKYDMLNKFLGKICVVQIDNGTVFISRIVQIDGNDIWFKTKDGKYIMDRRDTIVRLFVSERQFEDEEDGVVT